MTFGARLGVQAAWRYRRKARQMQLPTCGAASAQRSATSFPVHDECVR